jgi:hypothetical protein
LGLGGDVVGTLLPGAYGDLSGEAADEENHIICYDAFDTDLGGDLTYGNLKR